MRYLRIYNPEIMRFFIVVVKSREKTPNHFCVKVASLYLVYYRIIAKYTGDPYLERFYSRLPSNIAT